MRTVWILTLTLALGPVAAAEDGSNAAPGETTRAWLELQKSNNASWGEPRELPADVAQRIYERYRNSFEHPIPERFDSDSSDPAAR